MFPKLCGSFAAITLGLASALAAAQGIDGARDCIKDPRGNELQFFIENDSFGSSDQYYTNGLKLGVGVARRVSLRPVQKTVRRAAEKNPRTRRLRHRQGQ